jgi:hypothetical protein
MMWMTAYSTPLTDSQVLLRHRSAHRERLPLANPFSVEVEFASGSILQAAS